jgi:hypothetical protein
MLSWLNAKARQFFHSIADFFDAVTDALPGNTMPASRSFHCPNCDALYEVVRTEAGPETVHQRIACRVCDGPLPDRDRQFILKYFLLRESTRKRKRPSKGQ